MVPLKLDDKLTLRMQACTFDEFVARTSAAPAFAGSTAAYRDLLTVRRQEARLDPETQVFLATYPEGMNWLVLVAEDTPETLVLLPLLDRLAAVGPRINLRILREEEDSFALLAAFLEDIPSDLLHEPDLPLLLILDEDWQFQEQWGPFPVAMEPYLDEWLERHPEYETLAEDDAPPAQAQYIQMLERLSWEMRIWFNTALDVATGQELCELLRSLMDEDDGRTGDLGSELDEEPGDRLDEE